MARDAKRDVTRFGSSSVVRVAGFSVLLPFETRPPPTFVRVRTNLGRAAGRDLVPSPNTLHPAHDTLNPEIRTLNPVVGPREALRGGIPGSFLEPLVRSWSHFEGIYRHTLTRSLKN